MSLTIKLNNATVKVQIEDQTEPILNLDQLTDCIQTISRQLLEHWICSQQETCLDNCLGERWKRLKTADIDLACPECGSIHVRRKCWRPRKITVDGVGKLSLGRRQLYCVDCKACWMPFNEALELPSGAYDGKSLFKGIDAAMEQSYKKAGDSNPDGPSGSTIYRTIQDVAPPDIPQEVGTVVLDGTKIPRWKHPGQITVSLIHEIAAKEPTSLGKKRPKRRKRRVLGVAAGREADSIAQLDPLKIRSLVHDGNLKLDGQADFVGRCRWHVPYTVKYLFYRNDVSGKDNKKRVERLKNGLERHKADPEGLDKYIDKWLDNNSDAPVACTHVENSKEALLTMSRHPDEFTTHTTSHMEREMVELNKRFENGGGWTPEGAENLLWLHQLKRFEPEKYTQAKQKLINKVAFSNR